MSERIWFIYKNKLYSADMPVSDLMITNNPHFLNMVFDVDYRVKHSEEILNGVLPSYEDSKDFPIIISEEEARKYIKNG